MSASSAAVGGRIERRTMPIGLLALILFITLLGLNGVGMAIATFTATRSPAGPTVGLPISTGFGTLTVDVGDAIGGMTHEQLGGMTHGVGGLVEVGSAQVQVAVTLTNTSDHAVRIAPDQFGLVIGNATAPIAPAGGTIETLRLASGASVEAGLTFVVQQGGEPMTFTYAEPGAGAVVAVPIGSLGALATSQPHPSH